jgi:protein TonB
VLATAADPFIDRRASGAASAAPPRSSAILAAVLLHALVVLVLLLPRRDDAPMPTPPIPVTLIVLPPEPAQPKPTPPSPTRQSLFRRSGPDDTTTTARPQPPPVLADPNSSTSEAPSASAEAPKPAAEPPVAPRERPAPEQADPQQAETAPTPRATPAPDVAATPARKAAARNNAKPPTKPVPAARTAEARLPHPKEESADRETVGDPYLNALMEKVKQHLTYPVLARNLGLTGTTILDITVDRDGRILDMRVLQSSGAEILDRAAEQAFRDSAPLLPPPPPANGPALNFRIVATLPFRPS